VLLFNKNISFLIFNLLLDGILTKRFNGKNNKIQLIENKKSPEISELIIIVCLILIF